MKQTALKLGFVTEDEFDLVVDPRKAVVSYKLVDDLKILEFGKPPKYGTDSY